MKRKTIYFVLTTLLTICVLTGCQNTASSNEAEIAPIESAPVESAPATSSASAADCYQSVLKNEMTFIDTNNNNTPSYLNDVYYADDVTCTPKQYAMVDFDGDGEKEVCVEMDLGFDGEYLVLHYFDGTVYGYSFPYRAMEMLSEEGHYIGSNGASNNYIFSMTFNGAEYVEKTIAYSDLDKDFNPIYFNENEEEITEADFNALIDSMEAAPANWTAF